MCVSVETGLIVGWGGCYVAAVWIFKILLLCAFCAQSHRIVNFVAWAAEREGGGPGATEKRPFHTKVIASTLENVTTRFLALSV